MLIIAIIIYWNVHRKRKKARLEKEKQKENEIIEAPDDLLPHSTYLQTLMTLAGETLGKRTKWYFHDLKVVWSLLLISKKFESIL